MSVCSSVRPSVRVSVCGKHDCVRTLQTLKFASRLLLPIRWLVLKMGYIGPQDLVLPIYVKSVNWGFENMERLNYTKFDI